MNEQTKKAIQILVIIFFLAATVVVIFSIMQNRDNNQGVVMQDDLFLDEMENIDVSSEEIVAVKEEARVECDKQDIFATSTCADSFFTAEAMKEKKIDACALIEDEFLRTSCFDTTYLAIALGEIPDPSVCYKLSDKEQQIACADEANFRLAYQNQDLAKEYCNKIITELSKKSCLSKFNQ